jgi:hypothetical protein
VKIMTPTIHMNGSNAETLRREYLDAAIAAVDLLFALRNIDLNSRDYYVNPEPNAFNQARDQACARYTAVSKIRQELETIILSIQEQQR